MSRKLFQRRAPALAVRAAVADGEAEILLYDEIGFFGITARDFVQQLATVRADTIHLRVNSPGGDVFDGLAIYNALRAHGARVVTHVDGLAASIASVIALAGDEVLMAENAFFMIHDPWGITIGTAADHRKTGELLDKIADAIVGTYVAAANASAKEVEDWMAAETWFDAQEAIDAGFADAVEDQPAVAAKFDLSLYQHVPDRLAAMAPPAKRDAERTLRDAGLSRREAKEALAARHHPAAPPQRDAVDDGLLESCRQLVATMRGV